jgi:hypothetical protein
MHEQECRPWMDGPLWQLLSCCCGTSLIQQGCSLTRLCALPPPSATPPVLHPPGPYRLQLTLVQGETELVKETGVGRSKKEAKQTAAALLMNRAMDTVEDFRAHAKRTEFELERRKGGAAGGKQGRGAGGRYGADAGGRGMGGGRGRGGGMPGTGADARRALQQMGANQGPLRELAGGGPFAAGPGAGGGGAPKRVPGDGLQSGRGGPGMGGGGAGGSGGAGAGGPVMARRLSGSAQRDPTEGPLWALAAPWVALVWATWVCQGWKTCRHGVGRCHQGRSGAWG